MSLMKLAPETVRLRRIARACSAGEFSLVEYRQVRREVIANFSTAQIDDDDTQPRSPCNDAQPQPDPPEVAPRRHLTRWLALLLALGAIALTGSLMAAPAEIPPVAERDPNPATSPRLPVTRVRIESEPLALVDRARLQAVADEALAEVRQRNQPGGHGFTRGELEEVGRFLKALGVHQPGAELSAQDARDLSGLIEEQKSRRGVSVVELETVAASVQARVREAGYFLAVAYLPAQNLSDGEVSIALLPGVLGDVDVRGASARVAGQFADLLGKPLTAEMINTRMYTLNQSPGFSAQASFEPGTEVGETRLNLEVLEQRSWQGSVALDNFGDDLTGRQRLLLGADLLNPRGRGDLLSMGLLAGINPQNQLYGFVEYGTPVSGRQQLVGRVSRNDFSLPAGSDSPGPLSGDGWLIDVGLERHLYRDRQRGLAWKLGLGQHQLSWSAPTGDIDQSVSLVSAGLQARRVWDAIRVATDLEIYGDAGKIGGDRFAGQDRHFWDLGVRWFGWHPFDLGLLPGRQKISVSFTGQLAGSQLPTTRRLALGSVDAARGFDRDIFLADRGLLLRVDLRTPLPLGELAWFVDAAYGRNDNELTPGWAHLADVGIAWHARLSQNLVSQMSWAVPVTASGEQGTAGDGGLDGDGLRFFWSLRYAR